MQRQRIGGLEVSVVGLGGNTFGTDFFGARCDDICPVLATELRLAHVDLGADGGRVAFLTVNTDPLAVSRSTAGPAEHAELADSLSIVCAFMRE